MTTRQSKAHFDYLRLFAFILPLASLLVVDSPVPADEIDEKQSANAITQLKEFLDQNAGQVESQGFATVPLSKNDAATATQVLWEYQCKKFKKETADEIKNKVIKFEKHELKFDFKTFGTRPKKGHSLFISMHGGGGAPKRVNDQQWENQKRLYQPKEGIYLAPRAPTDTWNLWHQGHIDPLFDRLIQAMVVHYQVNPNRVYIMGYSAGGDGVYQIGPRMADRWAAAAMMAGHPNEASPLSLRNIGFTLHMGGRDGAYNRNKKAEEWKQRLAELQKNDPQGYQHEVQIHPGMGHWMRLKDAVAVGWMAKFTRNPNPATIVWHQDDVTHHEFYWLQVSDRQKKARSTIHASIDGQVISIKSSDVTECTILLNDGLMNLDQAIKVSWDGNTVHEGTAKRTIQTLVKTMNARNDANYMYSAAFTVQASEKNADE